MAFVGVALRTESGRARLRAVVIDGDAVSKFDYLTTDVDDIAAKVAVIADGLDGSLRALSGIEGIVVRQGDDGKRGGLTSAVVQRLRLEGAAIYVAQQHCPYVNVLSGPQVGSACGGNLADAEAKAASLAPATWKVAASAALAAKGLHE